MIFYEGLIKPNENIFNSFQHPVQNFLKQHQGQSNSMIFFLTLPMLKKSIFQYKFPLLFSSTKPTHLAVLQEDTWLNNFNNL